MTGGLARKVALAEKMQSEGRPVLVVDSGDLFFEGFPADPQRALTKAELIGRAYRKMGAAAVNVGDLDLMQGVDFLRREASYGLPLISANLVDSSTKRLVFPPFVVKEASGVRVAFFGVLLPDLRPDLDPARKVAGADKIVIQDPIGAAKETVAKLNGKADLIVLLSNLGLPKDIGLAKAVPGIHFILGGHEGRTMAQPHKEGKTFIVQSYAKGMYAGQMQLTFEKPGVLFQDKGRASQIQEQLRMLDLRIRSLQKAREQRPSPDLDRTMQELNRQKAGLQEDLKRAETESSSNSFLWTLFPLDSSMPDNKEVQGWIREAAIDKD